VAREKKDKGGGLGAVEAGLGEERVVAWRAFLSAHAAAIDRIEKDLAEAGVLPLSWYDVLLALYEAPGRRLRMHELAGEILITRGGLTRLVARIEGAGLLSREPDPEDGRGLFAVLTKKGLDALRTTWPVYAGGIAEHFARHLTDEEVEVIGRALGRVLDAARDG
jgi:DNA-binding MarR family transcriptional regulator